MKILVTGATGFIGNHVIDELISQDHEIVIICRNRNKLKKSWINRLVIIQSDILNFDPIRHKNNLLEIDKVIHLAWDGLSNYMDMRHLEHEMFIQYTFIKKLVLFGLNDFTITGTCFEYGKTNGQLDVTMITNPENPYAIAKDTLRKYLQLLKLEHNFNLKWVRLFYMYGTGQSSKSILSQLETAIKNKENTFNLSGGEQLRDYLPVEKVASNIIKVSLFNTNETIFNCCSGIPTSIRNLVESHLKINNYSIKLNFGFYKYLDFEPMAFWGLPNI
jgi:nucleoside-diphosphate-sugar epimerase